MVISINSEGLLNFWLKKERKNSIRQETGLWEDLITTSKKRRLKQYNNLSINTLQGNTLGKRRRGRERKKLPDNINDQTGGPQIGKQHIGVAGQFHSCTTPLTTPPGHRTAADNDEDEDDEEENEKGSWSLKTIHVNKSHKIKIIVSK